MLNSGFVAYLFHYMLRNHFHTKKRMAEAMGITYRTLLYNFQRLGEEKGGSIAFIELILYCLENGISLDSVYDEYKESGKNRTCLHTAHWSMIKNE